MKITFTFTLFFFIVISNAAYAQKDPQGKPTKSKVYVVSVMQESKNVYLYEERFMSGGLRTKGQFKSEKKRKKYGHWTTYYESGNIDHEGSYTKGRKDGAWTWYFESGKVAAIEAYRSGKRLSTTFYNENGEQVTLEQLDQVPTPPEEMKSFYQFIQQKSRYLTEARK